MNKHETNKLNDYKTTPLSPVLTEQGLESPLEVKKW